MIFSDDDQSQNKGRLLAVLGFTLAGAALLFASCSFDIEFDEDVEGTGDVITDSYDEAASFDVVRISDNFDAVIEIGPEVSVVVQAHENFFEYIKVEAQDGVLVVEAEGADLDGVANVTITTPSLLGVEVSGASSAEVLGTANNDELQVEVSGASEVSFERINAAEVDIAMSGASNMRVDNVSTTKLTIDASGASDLTIGGQATDATLSVSGASDVKFGDLRMDDVVVSVAGASDLDLRGADKISGDLSGTSSLRVAKNAELNIDVSGLSEIRD